MWVLPLPSSHTSLQWCHHVLQTGWTHSARLVPSCSSSEGTVDSSRTSTCDSGWASIGGVTLGRALFLLLMSMAQSVQCTASVTALLCPLGLTFCLVFFFLRILYDAVSSQLMARRNWWKTQRCFSWMPNGHSQALVPSSAFPNTKKWERWVTKRSKQAV